MPKVSVLMPAFNCEKYIQASVESILTQTFADFELLIIDDGSSDNTFTLLNTLAQKDQRIRLHKNEKNSGIAFTRNKLISLAKGEYIAWQDADDISSNERLKTQVEFLDKYQDYAFTSSWARIIDKNGNLTGEKIKTYFKDEDLAALFLFINTVVQSSVLIRRDILQQNPYSEDYPPVEDYELWVRLASQWKIHISPNYLLNYRVFSQNSSNTHKEIAASRVRLIHQTFLQKLGANPSKEQLELHNAVSTGQKLSYVQVLNTEKWFVEISNANKKSQLLEPQSLHKVLSHRFIKSISTTKDDKFAKIKLYLNTEFRQLSLRNVLLLLKFLIQT